MSSKSGRGNSSGSRGVKVSGGGEGKGKMRAVPELSVEEVEAGRKALVAEKQEELDRVYDRHDSLVREIFHMEHFRMMLGYDPIQAKGDTSNVFQNYKSQYDLWEKTSSIAGPSRSTRSARTERKHLIQEPIRPPSLSAPVASSSPGKRKAKAADNTTVWDILASAKDNKEKGKEKVTSAAEKVDSASSSIREGHSASAVGFGESISAGLASTRAKRKVRLEDPVLSDSPAKAKITPAKSAHKNDERVACKQPAISISSHKRPRLDPVSSNSSAVDDPGGPVFKIKGNSQTSLRTGHKVNYQSPSSRSRNVSAPVPRTTSFLSDTSAPSTSPSLVKRIRLIVRRPPPIISSPRQKPPTKKFSSISELLSSYNTLCDETLDSDALKARAHADAELLERATKLRKEGRLLADSSILNDDPDSADHRGRVSKDIWDHCIEDVIRETEERSKRTTGVQIAGQIAAKIRAHWDAQAVKIDKMKAQEERQLRALAKATIRMVTAEWKKAVFHIREQERLKEEAEELRRGHEHLDAILNQSGQILETQHIDLSRGDGSRSRSRDSSASASLMGWSEEEDEDDENDPGEDTDTDEEEDHVDEFEEPPDDDFDVDRVSEEGSVMPDNLVVEEDLAEIDHTLTGLPQTPSVAYEDSRSPSPAVYSHHSNDTPHSEIVELESLQLDASRPTSRSSSLDLGMTSQLLMDHDLSVPDDYPSPVSEDDELHASETPFIPSRSPSTATAGVLTPPNNVNELTVMGAVGQSKPEELDSSVAVIDVDAFSEGGVAPEVVVPTGGSAVEAAVQGRGLAALPPSSDVDVPHSPFISPSKGSDKALTSGGETILESVGDALTEPSSIRDTPLPDSELPREDIGKQPVENGATACPVPSIEEDAPAPPESDAAAEAERDEEDSSQEAADNQIPEYLKPYAVAPVNWEPGSKVTQPLLLRGVLRPYQFTGLEWLTSLHSNNLNGILADEMGLGKTIQTIALLAHLACDRGIWGPHLIIVPTSVLLNWEMEFKKFLPGFRILSYHGTTKRRKELRQGWNDKTHFNVCITSYTLASRDAHIFKRKPWYYMILDEAHMIKNFKSQRWNTLLMFRSFRRLLLTGTPLQNNLTELWALLQFLMSGANFANLKEFGEWFSNPLEKAIEMGNVLDDETMQRVSKLHTVLRPYLLRRLKRDVEKELPSKYEHLVLCPLSKRQRFLYDEFMARAQTRDALQSGVYQKIANILMQLRKVCNHPDLFEVRPIVTSFAMDRSAIADYEIKEFFVRRRLLSDTTDTVDLEALGLSFINHQHTSLMTALETRRLDAMPQISGLCEDPGLAPPRDTRTISGFRSYNEWARRARTVARWTHIAYLNHLRCTRSPVYSSEVLSVVQKMYHPILPAGSINVGTFEYLNHAVPAVHRAILSYEERAESMANIIDQFAFVTPSVVARDLARIALSGVGPSVVEAFPPSFDRVMHASAVKLQIAFPSLSLLQYDCGKLQRLAALLRERKAGGHRVLIFTQMTRILDILEIFLNFHGYLYLRLDGATRIEDRQYVTERFNKDERVFCFIASSRSGGVGINLTGADTVVFYDSDFNPQMDRQCEDRAHRIGQIRDVHIYRFVSQHTVEEAMLLKANQKRSLDDLVIQKGEFDWRALFRFDADEVGSDKERGSAINSTLLTKALGEFEDTEDAIAARMAEREENVMEGADEADFGLDTGGPAGGDEPSAISQRMSQVTSMGEDMNEGGARDNVSQGDEGDGRIQMEEDGEDDDAEEGGTVVDYMLAFIRRDYDFFREWRL